MSARLFQFVLVGGLVLLASGGLAHAGLEYETEVLLIEDDGGAAGDYFGYSVAASGNWMAVGTPFDSQAGFDAGAVHLYFWEAGEFVQIASIRPGDLAASDQLGYDIAMDGNVLIIGSPGNDEFETNSGAVYVYEFDSSGANFKQKLTSTNQEPGELFGFSVAISGDNLLGGSPYATDFTGESRGTVTTYELDGGVWYWDSNLETSAEGTIIEFGSAIDYDGARAIIGAPFSYGSSGGTGGSAEVFTYYVGFGFDSEGLIYSSVSDSGSMFGYAVSIDGSFLAVGAPGYNSWTGHVDFFNNDSGTFSNISSNDVTPPFDLDFGDTYGHAVHVSGNEVYAGSPWGSGGDSDTGCVHTMKIELDNSLNYVVSEVIRYSLSSLTSGNGYVGYRIDGSGDKIYAGAPNYNGSTGTVMYFGDERYWENPAGGFWETAANWSGNGVPGASSPVYFGLSNTYSVWTGNLSGIEVESIEVFDGSVTLESALNSEMYLNGGELGEGLKVGTTNAAMLLLMGQILVVEKNTSVGVESYGMLRVFDSYLDILGQLNIGQDAGGDMAVTESQVSASGVVIDYGGSLSVDSYSDCYFTSDDISTFALQIPYGTFEVIDTSTVTVGGAGVRVSEDSYFQGNGQVSFGFGGRVANYGVVTPTLDDTTGDDVLVISGGHYWMTGEDNSGNDFEGKLTTSTWDGTDAAYLRVEYDGQFNGGDAVLGGVYQLTVPDTNTVASGNTFPALQAEWIVDNFTTYLVPYVNENLYFKFNTNLARGGSGGGASIDGEVADLVIPFGFNSLVTGPTTAGEAVSVRAMNVDGDTDDDLLVLATSTHSGDAVCVFLNEGGTLCLHDEIPVLAAPTDMAAADFDNDGDEDLAVTCSSGNKLVILRNDGGGDFTSILTIDTGNNPSALTVFHWNGGKSGDTLPDIALVNQDDDTLYVYQNTSTFRSIGFGTPNSSGTSENPSGIAPGDVDPGGGKDEDVVVSGADGEITYHINGGGTWDSTELFDTGTTIGSMGVLDMDLDGVDDVFLTYPDTSESGVIYGPTGSLVEDVLPIGGSGFNEVDLDGDGDEDGVYEGPGGVGRGSIAIRVLRNDSNGQPIDVVVFMDVPGDDVTGTSTINTGMDVDSDGHQDLVAVANLVTTEFTLNVQTSSNGSSWAPATCATDECDEALPATCPADVSGAGGVSDGFVDVTDLLAVIANWGQSGDGVSRPMGDCRPLPNGDCTVNVEDLLGIISEWNSTCTP